MTLYKCPECKQNVSISHAEKDEYNCENRICGHIMSLRTWDIYELDKPITKHPWGEGACDEEKTGVNSTDFFEIIQEIHGNMIGATTIKHRFACIGSDIRGRCFDNKEKARLEGIKYVKVFCFTNRLPLPDDLRKGE